MSEKERREEVPPAVGRSFVQDLYVNSVNFQVGVYDVAMTFGLQGTDRPPEYLVRLHMSPQHALVMCAMLMNNMRAYESLVGPVSIPVDLAAKLELKESLESLRKLSVPKASLKGA